MKKDLRTFMADCEKKLPKEFVRVTRQVDPKYEISAVIKKLDLMGKYPLVLFEKVKGYQTSGRLQHRDELYQVWPGPWLRSRRGRGLLYRKGRGSHQAE